MSTPPGASGDTRAVIEYRIPAPELRAGDLINTSPGNEDDWQQVLSVHTLDRPGTEPEIAGLITEIGDRYVLVRLTDVAPVDNPLYFEAGTAMAFGGEDGDDSPVTEIVSAPEAARTFLYTRYEVVTVRAR